MTRRTLGRLLCAACLALCAAFAYQSLAAAQFTTTMTETSLGGRQAPVLRGKVPLAFGAYELSVSFTPDGSIRHFHLDSASAGARRCGDV